MQDNHWLNFSLHICKVYVSRLKFWQQPAKLSNVAASKDKYWNSIVTRLKKAKQYWDKWHACCQLRCGYRTLHMNCPKSTNMACLNSLPWVYFPMIGVFPLKHWALMPMGSAFNIWSRCSRPAEHEGPDSTLECTQEGEHAPAHQMGENWQTDWWHSCHFQSTVNE